MTTKVTKVDERIGRIETAIERLEALGLSLEPTPQVPVNPDGSPGNVASGELVESAWGNAVANTIANLRSLDGCRIKRLAPQLIATATSTEIQFDNEDADHGNYFTGPSVQVIIPAGKGGLFLVGGSIQAAANTGTTCFADLKINNVVYQRFEAFPNASPPFPMMLVQLAPADTLKLAVQHSAGVAVNFAATMIVTRMNSGLAVP